MSSALQSRNGIAVGIHKRIDCGRPGNRPFNSAFAVFIGDLTEKGAGNGFCSAQLHFEEIQQTAGKFQYLFRRDFPFRLQQRWVAFPTDFNAAEEIGLGARHAINQTR